MHRRVPQSRWLVLAVVACLGCAHHLDSLAMHLTWSPSSDPGDVPSMTLSAFSGQKVQLLPVTDARTTKEIGANVQELASRPVSAVDDDVAGFVTAHLADVLQASHVLLVQGTPAPGAVAPPQMAAIPGAPTRVLRTALTQFFVKEDNTYNGTVILAVTLLDPQGKELWQGIATGHSKRFGRSLSAENYNECLSESLMDAAHDLLKNPTFLDAVHGK